MAPRTRIIGAVRFLLFSASVLAVLAQPGVAVAQTSCLNSVEMAKLAFGTLVTFRSTITAADVVDLEDVQKGLDGAIASLADNVSGARSRLDRLCDRLADLVSGSREVFIAADDCVGAANSITCDGAVIFENYQDAIEDLAEDALPKITSSTRRGELRDIIAQVYASIERLVALVIAEAKLSVSSASDSPAIVDAMQQQNTALTQEATCFLGTTQVGTTQRACGDAVGSFFDAWLNGIIEIIE
jgi:hypothetical protein